MGVFIREKNGHLYLDYRIIGRRHWEALHLTIGSDERHNREARKLAEIIRSKKELQIVSGEHGLLDPVEGKRPLVPMPKCWLKSRTPRIHSQVSQVPLGARRRNLAWFVDLCSWQ